MTELKAHSERIINFGLTVGGLAIGAAAIFDAQVLHVLGGFICVTGLPGAYMFVRAFRLGVTITPETVLVRGLVASRRIDRRTIVGVTNFPSVQWTSESGRIRKSPITAFANINGRDSRKARSYNAEKIAELHRILAPAVGTRKDLGR